ncbi:hypothetical protein H310_00939 [Aphanomyces invadans]|uniref:N-acetyltransferase domain-containing protein n=1 Tax=Aphanomyces invadans TaxID=157072 RepID=A0A024UPV0_9STRA|nr:hypothetical protein H310_00939 [Aphanomyces invadans]ETW08329.1 hypothetical protein H310_00939 [Aphanomyces invadans]|eukprot:XP_008862134.1 hypothetical protein H310_00939 [Aphanomyces invadans]
MPATVHRAAVADIDRIAPLFDGYRMFYRQPSDIGRAKTFLFDRLSRQESVLFFAVDDQGCAGGFVQLYPSFSSVTMERVWILNDLFVVPAARRQGIAKLLMNHARDFAQADGAKGLSLETDHDNYVGQGLYEALGYAKSTGFHYFLSLKKQA